MSHLFEPLRLRSLTLKNRIGMSPMCQYSATDGLAADWHLVHYGSRAAGGAGLVIVEATAVEARGRISPHDLGIWSDEQTNGLARLAQVIRGNGAAPCIQIAHAGRKAGTVSPLRGGGVLKLEDGGWPIVAPSPLPFTPEHQTPAALSIDEIAAVQQSFVDGARRAQDAGFDALEIHGAHGYLISSFLSPLANKRKDPYGGDFTGRVRFLTEITTQVRSVWPSEKPLIVRLSCSDWIAGGWTVDETVSLAAQLAELGVDMIDCSSGGNHPDAKPVQNGGPAYQVGFAEAVKHGAAIPAAAVGMITQATHADAIVRNDRADVVLLGRELLRNPYWPLHAAQQLRADAEPPDQYRRAFL